MEQAAPGPREQMIIATECIDNAQNHLRAAISLFRFRGDQATAERLEKILGALEAPGDEIREVMFATEDINQIGLAR